MADWDDRGTAGKGDDTLCALRRARRALDVLSRCNRLMADAEDEAAFLEDVCSLIVERGGYRLAWIGMKDREGGKAVIPVARAGHDRGYVDGLKLTWDESERGRGPTGRAIRSGRPVVARNIVGDPAFSPWREDAIERGFASSLALPIFVGDECIGALNIYAAEPDAFDEEEKRLL